MTWANPAVLQLTLLWTNVAAAVLALLFLVLEYWASRIWARRALGFATLALAVGASAAWLVCGWGRAGFACGLLAAFCLVAWGVSFEATRQHLSRLLTPKAVWAVVLVASLASSHLLGSQLLRTLRDVRVPDEIQFADDPVTDVQGLTDRGRPIALFRFETVTAPEEIEAAILAAADYQNRVLRLAGPSDDCNCHGWVFAAGRYGVRSSDVPAILADNGYLPVPQAQEGDLAVYTNGDQCTHSGQVRLTQVGGAVLVESKWGPFGVFLHAPDAQPFSGTCTFYRSSRAGHLLRIEPR